MAASKRAARANTITKAQKEEQELEESFRKVAGYSSKKKANARFNKRLPSIVIICIMVAVITGGIIAGYVYFASGIETGKILDGVSIAGVDVGGMTKSEAVQAVQAATSSTYACQSMTITVLGQQYPLSPALSGAALDVKGAVETAYTYGRRGSQSQRKQEQLLAFTAGIQMDVIPYLHLNTDAIRQQLEALAESYNTAAVQSSYEILGERPDLIAGAQVQECQQLKLTLGMPGYALDADALYSQVTRAYNCNTFQVTANCTVTEPEAIDLQALYDQTRVEPADAVMDGETFEVSSHSYGYCFDLESAQAALADGEYGQELTFSFYCVEPEVTQEELSSVLFRDVLSSYTACAGSDPDRDVNLKLSCQAINGIVLMPGEIFSYNPALGERTPERGYKPANGYVGSQTVIEYGGGICQASSCLYYCAMTADLQIVERYNHGFISAYMPYGMDATVSWGGPEFRFCNSSDYPIRIEANASGGAVTVKLIGTDTKSYYVKMEYEILTTDPYETVFQEMAPDNEDGYQDGDTIISPYTGYKINTYRCKYDKQTNDLISRELEAVSTYSRRDKVVCKIVEPEQTTPSESTAPPETTSPGVSGTVTEDT